MPLPEQSILEKHLQTVLLALVIALIGWMGKTTLDTSQSMASLKASMTAQLDNLKTVVAKLDTYADDRYSRTEAEQTHQSIEHRIDQLDNRVRTLEERRR